MRRPWYYYAAKEGKAAGKLLGGKKGDTDVADVDVMKISPVELCAWFAVAEPLVSRIADILSHAAVAWVRRVGNGVKIAVVIARRSCEVVG